MRAPKARDPLSAPPGGGRGRALYALNVVELKLSLSSCYGWGVLLSQRLSFEYRRVLKRYWARAVAAMEAFNKLVKIPVEPTVNKWKNMPKERVMKMTHIESIKYSDFIGKILHYHDVVSGVVGKVFPPKAFLQHLELHHKNGDDVFFCIKEGVPPGEIDFEIRFRPS